MNSRRINAAGREWQSSRAPYLRTACIGPLRGTSVWIIGAGQPYDDSGSVDLARPGMPRQNPGQSRAEIVSVHPMMAWDSMETRDLASILTIADHEQRVRYPDSGEERLERSLEVRPAPCSE